MSYPGRPACYGKGRLLCATNHSPYHLGLLLCTHDSAAVQQRPGRRQCRASSAQPWRSDLCAGDPRCPLYPRPYFGLQITDRLSGRLPTGRGHLSARRRSSVHHITAKSRALHPSFHPLLPQNKRQGGPNGRVGTLNRLNNKERHCLQLQAVPFFDFTRIITSYPQCCLPALWGSAHPAR